MMPSRTSKVRLRPGNPAYFCSKDSTMRKACRLWSNASWCCRISRSSSDSPEWPPGRVPHVMHQRQRLHQVGVQAQRLRHRAADLRHFQRVRQAIAEVIGISPGENLRLVLQAAESARVDECGRDRVRNRCGKGAEAPRSAGLATLPPAWRTVRVGSDPGGA